jgi:hypothetical protein
MSGSALGYNILTDASAAFAAHTIRQPKTDGGAAVSEADTDDYPGATWFNEIDDQLILLSQAVQGDAQVAAWDVLGTLDVDGAATLGDNLTLSSATPYLVVGNGSGSPAIQILKSDAGTAELIFQTGTDKFYWTFNASEGFFLNRSDGGVWQEQTAVEFSTHKWTFPDDVDISGDLDHNGTGVGFYGSAPVSQSTGWAVSNLTPDKVLDCNSTSTAELADVLGTLITHLLSRGDLGA